MQNKTRNTLTFLGALLLSVAFGVPAMAQTQPGKPARTAPARPSVKPATATKPAEMPVTTPDTAPAMPASDIAARTEAAKRMLEQNLADADTQTRQAVNFPSRPQLGDVELAPLPGINDTILTGPAPMDRATSKRDMPSEQLLGRVTSEVFSEMADLERGNTFLKLQMQKETLRNDLEKLKTAYRQNRLDEITKRENVIKERIKWWQEQEQQRIALEQKKAEAELIDQQIADAEATRERLRQEALDRMNSAPVVAQTQTTDDGAPTPVVATPVVPTLKSLAASYAFVDVKGARGVLMARLKDPSGVIIAVRVGDTLPSGHVVREITKDRLTATINGIEDTLPLLQSASH